MAAAIREQLSSRGISNKNAIFVLSSAKIVNREVVVPFVKPNKIRGIINANSSEYFPVNIEDYVVSHSVLETVVDAENNKQIRVLAVAAPTQMVKSYYELAGLAGLNVVSVDYIGNAMLQLIKTQTSANATTMVIQLGSESTVLNIVQGDNLLLQRTVPYGTNSVVNVIMDEKGVDATTAMTLLQNDRLITVDFDDNEATGAFRYLINNIGRVMDYYASKNPEKPIDDVFLTGDGALIKGIDGLFKIQLNVNTRIMDSLYNIKFDPSIDLKVYNPVYLVTSIGAAFAPMGFDVIDPTAKVKGGSGVSLAPFVALTVVAAIAGAGLAFYSIKQKNDAETERDNLNSKIAAISDIEQIIADHDQAKAEYMDVIAMYNATYQLNENVRTFISELESKIPTTVVVTGFTSTNEGVNIPCVSADYDSIADCIDDAYVASIAKKVDESTGQLSYEFTVTAIYVNTNPKAFLETEEETTEAPEETSEEESVE